MTGLFLLFIAAVWIALAAIVAYALTSRIKGVPLRLVIAFVLLTVLLPLPLVDEVVGKWQFEQLCRENSTIQVDRATAVGKTVYYDPQPAVEVKEAWIRIVSRPQRYVDSTTGNAVISFNTLLAEGGRFVQTFGTSEGRMPLIFRGSCGPTENVRELFKALDITPQDRTK
jgi:hypothetical protein